MVTMPANLKIAKANERRNAKQRCGFSLMELILVMVILVFVAALAVPSAFRSFSAHSLEKGAALVKTKMGQARVKAIKSGEIYAVYYVPGLSWHGIAPFKNVNEQMSVARRKAEESKDRVNVEQFADDLLPTGVVFGDSEAAEDSRAAQAVMDENSSSTDVKVVLFYPDGSSQDAVIYLKNDRDLMRAVELRGLTGTATTARVTGN